MILSEYLLKRGRGAMTRLSREVGAHLPDMSRWATGRRPVPPRYAAAIERATRGAVTRQELRPHDWWLIWPELTAPKTSARRRSP